MTKKTEKDRQKKNGRGLRDLRDQTIIAKAMQGESNTDIAKEMGISRQTVSEILNSDQVKAKIKEIDKRLAKGIDDAIKTILKAVKHDYLAARDLIKNFGGMKTTLDLNHNFPRPTVIVRPNGDQVILGMKEDEE